MIRVQLEIDNHTAYSCSPVVFLGKYIFTDADLTHEKGIPIYHTPYAKIKVVDIEQI